MLWSFVYLDPNSAVFRRNRDFDTLQALSESEPIDPSAGALPNDRRAGTPPTRVQRHRLIEQLGDDFFRGVNQCFMAHHVHAASKSRGERLTEDHSKRWVISMRSRREQIDVALMRRLSAGDRTDNPNFVREVVSSCQAQDQVSLGHDPIEQLASGEFSRRPSHCYVTEELMLKKRKKALT